MSSKNSIRVEKAIEEAILSGIFKPRERLIENDLISKYGVSRTVIREALKGLEAKGLVTSNPYRGVSVSDLTAEEVEEIYALRVELETIGARMVLKNITESEIREIKKIFKETEKHFKKKTHHMIEADSLFHRAIFAASKNRYLAELIDYLRTKAHIVRFNAWSIPNRIEQSNNEHKKIIKAIEGKDLRQLKKLIVQHLIISKESYLSQLRGGDMSRREGNQLLSKLDIKK